MYEVDSAKFTSKADPKQEFIQYFKESGAAAVLQKAMVSLYRMPVKPTNLTEYFSQYFENGAQRLTRISLLKAELCYKRGELQNRGQKIKEVETHIEELRTSMGISEDEFNEHFVPKNIKEQNRLSILERYFKDMEEGLNKTLEEVAEEARANGILENPLSSQKLEYGGSYDWENDCVSGVDSELQLRQDIKRLDPWGIICKLPNTQFIRDSEEPRGKHASRLKEGHNPFVKSDISLLNMEADGYDEDHDVDDDDDTLAEIFHQASRDWNAFGQDDEMQKLHSQLLAVRKADNTKIADFRGWSPLQSSEDITQLSDRTHENEEVGAGIEQQLRKKQVGKNVDKYPEGMKELQLPCCNKQQKLLQSQVHTATDGQIKKLEEENDAFLLDDQKDLEQVYRSMEAAHNRFDFEFSQYTKPISTHETPEICEPVCHASELALICPASPALTECPCGDDLCTCTPPATASDTASLGFVPGHMKNWTYEFDEYLCPDTGETEEYTYDEGDPISSKKIRNKQQRQCDEQMKDLQPPTVPLVRLDSSCHCLLTGLYSTSELMGELEEDEQRGRKLSLEQPSVSSESKEERKKRSTRKSSTSSKRDEATNTDTVLENELDDVFKQRRRSTANSIKKSMEHRETKIQGGLTNDDDMEEVLYPIDVFGIDLAKEVKRDILGFT